MIARSHIFRNLKKIESLYNKSSSPQEGLIYSKIAILELCGWIEESMDDIIRTCGRRAKLKVASNKKYIEEDVIKPTMGFHYTNHFRKMLMDVMGIRNLEKLENSMNVTKVDIMKSTLGTLKKSRDNEAHTHLRGITKTLDAPSVTLRYFIRVYEGLKNIEETIKLLKI